MKTNTRFFVSTLLVALFLTLTTTPLFAHCDSYDGPTVKDAQKALESNNVSLVLKWISPEQEQIVVPLFQKTYALKTGDQEVYKIVEKHFLETLVRLHRETEGAPFTGLKPAGSTKKIVQLSDKALVSNQSETVLGPLSTFLNKVIREKYDKVISLEKIKNNSPQQGRAYVKAYVDYTHTIEAIHDLLEQGGGHAH